MASIKELDYLKIPLEDIKLATNNFSDTCFIGQGGFGRVYKGQLPISSSTTRSGKPTTTVAVKRLDVKGGQGQHEFLIEIVMLSSYKHDNLVSLIGFSEEGDEKIIVYEHEVRGSLDKYLATDLTWVQCLQICLGAARGLNYLHSVLFEVLCGRLGMIGNYDDERRFLSHLARLRFEEGKLDEIILPSIRKQIKTNSLQIFSRIAYQCLEMDRKQRPTMALIMEQLQTSLEFQIGCRRMTRIGLWGSSTGGSPWSSQLGSNQKLRKIMIDHEDWIYSIGFTTEEFGASSCQELKWAKIETNHPINFDANEEITGILGTVGVTTGRYAGYIVISSLCFMTNKTRHRPFGKETGTPFSVPWELGSFAGFYGRAGFYLDGLGCYLKATI
ncbi:jacalin-like lectin domain-containing protein [Artemisia annua]|uniref:Jacalin-like lectin domain-containing protein n=1 Tax=Artemisia annua TaxID=35608 RepID=A0A2U1Q5C6_ARTAN|nr:jacalin-like lectin domain-containing protein [Artemisia annua]